MNTRLLFLFPLLAGSRLTAQENCAISGTVIDAITARPVPQVKVFAEPRAGEDESPAPVRHVTNARGEFCFERLSAGGYKLTAGKPGYLDFIYGQQHADGPALPVIVSADRAQLPLVLKIVPQATISGIVIDADGDPLPYGQVHLYKRPAPHESALDLNSGSADDQGRFRLWGVAPGTYYLSASPPSPLQKMSGTDNRSLDNSGHPAREREVETFYRAALAIAGATPLAIKGGQELTGITIAILKASARRISGRVSWDVQTGGLPMIFLRAQGEPVTVHAAVETDGRFYADGLTPGVYTLFGYTPDAGRLSGMEQIDVSERDAEGILIQLRERVEIKVSVHVEGSKAPPLVEDVDLFGKGDYRAQPNEDGTWRLGRLPPDVYHFKFWPDPGHYFVKALLIDGEPQPGATLDLSAHLPQSVEVTLALATGAITGTVINGAAPVPASTIVLMDEATQETVQIERLPAGGRFDSKPVAPGSYRLYALEDFDREVWNSGDFRKQLASRSTLVELRDAEKREASVPLISAQECRAALAQLEH